MKATAIQFLIYRSTSLTNFTMFHRLDCSFVKKMANYYLKFETLFLLLYFQIEVPKNILPQRYRDTERGLMPLTFNFL